MTTFAKQRRIFMGGVVGENFYTTSHFTLNEETKKTSTYYASLWRRNMRRKKSSRFPSSQSAHVNASNVSKWLEHHSQQRDMAAYFYSEVNR